MCRARLQCFFQNSFPLEVSYLFLQYFLSLWGNSPYLQSYNSQTKDVVKIPGSTGNGTVSLTVAHSKIVTRHLAAKPTGNAMNHHATPTLSAGAVVTQILQTPQEVALKCLSVGARTNSILRSMGSTMKMKYCNVLMEIG